MTNRRIHETLGIRYCDINVMGEIINQVTAMLKAHDAIDSDQTLIVNFDKFGPRRWISSFIPLPKPLTGLSS